MIVEPIFTIGEVVRDVENPDNVFEITGIETALIYDRERTSFEEMVTYYVSDIKVSTHRVYMVEEERLLLTDMEDIERYLDGIKLKPLSELDELIMLDEYDEGNSLGNIIYIKSNQPTEEPKRDIDEVLDEYSDYLTLIDMFGDVDGYYREVLDSFEEEIKEITSSK